MIADWKIENYKLKIADFYTLISKRQTSNAKRLTNFEL
jgi:hypothetical protein